MGTSRESWNGIQRIAVVGRADPRDVRAWSGVPYHIARAFEEHFEVVECFWPPRVRGRRIRNRLAAVRRSLTGKHGRAGFNRVELWARAAVLSKQIARMRPDAVFIAGVDGVGSYLQTDAPIINHSDTTFAAMRGYYPMFSDLAPGTARLADRCARRCIQRAAMNIYPSRWAARSAIEDYQADPARVHVVPYGANMEDPPTRDAALAPCANGSCRLLLVGGDWERKRGDIAVSVVDELVGRGMDVTLDVVGRCPVEHPRVRRIGFLNKGLESDRARYRALWADAHFFILPTSAECFGMVFAEAAAWGLPVISCETGGIPEVVEQSRTGELLGVDAPPNAYADAIERLWRDPVAYAAMRTHARDRFEQLLNWKNWGHQVADLIRTGVGALQTDASPVTVA